MRHQDAKVGVRVKTNQVFNLSGDMSVPKNSSGNPVSKGTTGTVRENPLRVRGKYYVPVLMMGRKLDILAKYLDLA